MIADKFVHRLLRRPYRLHMTDHGGTGPVIVLLHGIAASSASWEELIPLIKNNYHVVTLDLLGFGQSPKPQWIEYTVDDHLRCIHYTLKSLRLKRPIILVGHSLGALLAARYSRFHSKRIQRLVLCSPPIYVNPASLTKKGTRRKTSAYLALYRYLRTHKDLTIRTAMRVGKILPEKGIFSVREETWIPFVRSLEHCIELQTFIDDVAHVSAKIDVFYGQFDQVIVKRNFHFLEIMRHVTIHKVTADHQIGKRYAAAIAAILLDKPKLAEKSGVAIEST
jgi:pimeloyl-ACP methyl ester carboxylesterase